MKRSLSDVLAQHQEEQKKKYPRPLVNVQDAVFTVINHNQNLDKLADESTSLKKTHKDIDAETTADGYFAALKDTALSSSIPLASLTASKLASRLNNIIFSKCGDSLLLDEQEQAEVNLVIGTIKLVQIESGFNRASFTKSINKGEPLPLEMVWRLHTSGIMTLDSYIKCNLDSPGIIGNFPSALIAICKCEPGSPSEDMRKNITKDILSFLVQHGYSDKPTEGASVSKGMKKVTSALLDSIAKKILVDEGEAPAFCMYEALMESTEEIQHNTLKQFSCRQISVLLRHNPVHTVSEALQQQEGWTFAKTPPYVRDILTNVLLPLTPEAALAVFSAILEQQEVNWKTSLTFLATFLVLFEEASQLVLEKVNSLLAIGLEKCEMDSLILAFLLVRQGAYEGPHVFPSYQDWFGRTLGDLSRSPASNRKNFTFLMKFLTDIVPYENVMSLKAHIHRPPTPPPTCRPLLSDYVILAKTRLQDLQVPIEDATLYDTTQSSSEKYKIEKQSEQDVEMALAAYEKTGKVPSSVMEASIFRKPYFIGRFLPALLKPRPLPDDPDARMNFISALHRADKIPSSLINNYKKACQTISSELLEGILADDDAMEDLLLTPINQLDNALNNFAEAVIRIHSGQKNKTGIAGLVSIISEKLTTVENTEGQHQGQKMKTLCIDVSQSHSATTVNVVDSLLETICKILAGLGSCVSPQGSWLHQLLVSLQQHGGFWAAFLAKTWQLLVKHGTGLAPCHVNGLAAIVLHLASGAVNADDILIKDSIVNGPYIDALVRALPWHTRKWMSFTLQFCTCYIQNGTRAFKEFTLYYDETQQAVMPPALIQKFFYLMNRLCPESRAREAARDEDSPCEAEYVLPLKLYCSVPVTSLLSSIPLSFAEWVDLELRVYSHEDALSCWQRQDYYSWVLRHYVRKQPASGDVYASLCSDLINGILNHDLRPHPLLETCACSESPRQKLLSPNQSTKGNSRDHVLSFLQSLVTLLPGATFDPARGHEAADIVEMVPWLAKVWHERKAKVNAEEDSIAMHLEHEAFFRLARTLLPGFFSNNLLDNTVC